MKPEVEQEFERFVELYKCGMLKGINKFMEDWYYEDEFSGNEIKEMQYELELAIKEYLDAVEPSKYQVCGGWAVFVKEL